MPVYLVRIIESRDLVGIFSAAHIDRLIVLIDECCDPGGCEYLILSHGGIMWTSPAIAIPITVTDDDAEPDPMPWATASFTESWWDYVYGFAGRKWRPIFPDEPLEPIEPVLPERHGPGHVVPFSKKPKL